MVASGMVKIKPLSVNKCWQGRRFKTDEYKQYEKEVLINLKPMKIPEGDLFIQLDFGVSNMASDIDNPVKPFLDILQKKYKFDDKRITALWLSKNKVKKGSEFINFQIIQDVQT
jgi:Holliday junction resolvase RusA-like endonuclease